MVITTGQEENKLCENSIQGRMFGSLCCCNLERDSKVRAYIIIKNESDDNNSMHKLATRLSVCLRKIHSCFWITAPKNQL